jgi:hypothetical protein
MKSLFTRIADAVWEGLFKGMFVILERASGVEEKDSK